jgi:LPXTG-site transpeptidase (sortase) family protein
MIQIKTNIKKENLKLSARTRELLYSAKFRWVLTVLLSLVFLVSTYLLVYPLLPGIRYQISPPDPNKVIYQISSETADKLEITQIPDSPAVQAIPKDNRLVISKIGVDSAIVEGSDLIVLNTHEGVWRDPASATPDTIGNMVIAGHRLQYLPPITTTFYNLDKLAVGDRILVFWKKKSYVYEVISTRTLTPDHVEVTENDPKIPHELTLYTCTPLATRTNRLVIQAKLI